MSELTRKGHDDIIPIVPNFEGKGRLCNDYLSEGASKGGNLCFHCYASYTKYLD